jgi:TPR repeat protein
MQQAPRSIFLSLALLPLISTPVQADVCPQAISSSGYVPSLKSRAAAQDEAAMLSLAHLYLKGICLPQDTDRGRQLYEKLAKNGHPEAEFRLGLIHLNGYGVEKNFIIADEMFRRAIAHGHPSAQQFLDFLNEEGFDDC